MSKRAARVTLTLLGLVLIALAVETTLLVTAHAPLRLTVKAPYTCHVLDQGQLTAKCNDEMAALVRRVCRSRGVVAVDLSISGPYNARTVAVTRVCSDYR